MTDTAFNASGTHKDTVPEPGIRTILQWLQLPLPPHPADELPSLRSHLKALRELAGTPQQHARALDGLYERSATVISRLLPSLATDLVLPVPRKERRIVRSVLDLLQMLADDTLALLEAGRGQELPDPCQAPGLAVWRSLNAIAQQILVSSLIAAPARTGAWQQLHQTYATARRLQLHAYVPKDLSRSVRDVYRSAILLGCAQPPSMTPPEVLFLAAYLERFTGQIEPLPTTAVAAAGMFWIDPARDGPAISCLRKLSPPTVPLDGFSCVRLCLLLKAQIAQLDAGILPQEINLPAFAGTSAGRGVLHRLAERWSDAGKRRFPRRRQDHRTLLATGIDGVWLLSRKGEATDVELSTWLIGNESPDGYAVMHVSGHTGALSVGDVAAVRTGSDPNWQIGIVRWAVSENPEHLELGLQILAPRAVPAILAQPSNQEGTEYFRVLILPAIPRLRSSELLVVASGVLPTQHQKLILVIEDENVFVREVHCTRVHEQTSSVEILSIESD
jgi:hypothetical protein